MFANATAERAPVAGSLDSAATVTARESPAPGARAKPTKPASLLTNTATMLLAQGYGLAVGGVLAVIAARTFSVETFGEYSIALAMIGIFGLLAEAGIGFLAVRRFGEEPTREQQVLAVALSAEVLTGTAAVILSFPVALAFGYSASVVGLLAIGAGVIFGRGFLSPLDALFQARRIWGYAAIVTAGLWTVTLATGLAVLMAGAGPAGLVAASVAGYAVAAVLAVFLVRVKTGVRIQLSMAWRSVLSFVRLAVPVGIVGSIAVVYQRVDVLLISVLDTTEGVAFYSVALTLVQLASVIPSIVGGAFFPVLNQELRTNADQAYRSFNLLARIFVVFGVPVGLVLAFAGSDLITLLFGEAYEGSSTAVTILAATATLTFFQQLFWYGMLAVYRERSALGVMAGGLVVNVVLNIALIPPYGIEGAAAALLITDVVIIGWLGTLLHRRHIPLAAGRLLALPSVASVIAVGCGLLALAVGDVAAAAAATVVFAGILIAVQYIEPGEWQPLVAPLRGMANRLWGASNGRR
jgi:O-antigen/teichoic acid export membrane protein